MNSQSEWSCVQDFQSNLVETSRISKRRHLSCWLCSLLLHHQHWSSLHYGVHSKTIHLAVMEEE